MPTITSGISVSQPYSVITSRVAEMTPLTSLTTPSNEQTNQSDTYDIKLSSQARALNQEYETDKEELKKNHDTKKKEIESEYKHERQKLEQEYKQKRKSMGLSLYA